VNLAHYVVFNLISAKLTSSKR